ncbi:MAG: hypothetical protein V2A79_09775 [Planctomycetota bacterium]
MDIDFTKPLTDEQKEYLKANLEHVEAATGTIAFDTKEPLSRTAMEQLKVKHQIAGREQEFSVWDAVQGKAKAGGADEAVKKAKDALKVVDAADRIKAAQDNGEDADPADIMLVASRLVSDPEALLAAADDGKNGKDKKPAPRAAATDQPRQVKLVELDPEVRELLLPTKHHRAFVGELLDAEGEKILKENITKALANDPKRKAVEAKLGSDANKKAIMAAYDKIAIGTVDQQARGRIVELRGSGEGGDILGEIPAIAARFVETMNPQTILDKALPQPILLGGRSPDDAPLKVLSDEDLTAIPKFDATWPEEMAKRAAQKLAREQMAATG